MINKSINLFKIRLGKIINNGKMAIYAVAESHLHRNNGKKSINTMIQSIQKNA